MANQRPIIAFLYDFAKPLCTTDMQNYAFIPSLGMTPADFWAEANGFGRRNRIDGVLAYMYTMLREAEKKNLPFTRADLVDKGRGIVFFPGVEGWFRRINDYGETLGVQVACGRLSRDPPSAENSRRSTPASFTMTKTACRCGPSWR